MIDPCLQVDFERSGGFSGITISRSVIAKDLSADEAKNLSKLIQDADFFGLPSSITSRSPQPDRFQYQLTVKECSRQHTINVSEQAMPAKLELLVNYLMKQH